MNTHELKTWPEYFDAVLDGSKTFEVRRNDRDFHVGDYVRLNEYAIATGYSGRVIAAKISYLLDLTIIIPGVARGDYVVFGLHIQ